MTSHQQELPSKALTAPRSSRGTRSRNIRGVRQRPAQQRVAKIRDTRVEAASGFLHRGDRNSEHERSDVNMGVAASATPTDSKVEGPAMRTFEVSPANDSYGLSPSGAEFLRRLRDVAERTH
jgi:hypothetical protein